MCGGGGGVNWGQKIKVVEAARLKRVKLKKLWSVISRRTDLSLLYNVLYLGHTYENKG